MCGIAGIVDFSGTVRSPVTNGSASGPDVLADAVARMIGAIRHRGPDASGIVHRGRAVLGHARLSIVDLSGGAQPMSLDGEDLWVTFNGEIFNFVELREELTGRGHRFATSSDTEVILHAYREWGVDCVTHFNGQWAFALWDGQQGRLFLSRDRIGVRPLFYTQVGSRLFFASETKALLTQPEIKADVDLDALDEIFTFWTTIGSRSFFQGIQQLPPGHNMVVTESGIHISRYWSLSYDPDSAAEAERRGEASYVEELEALLRDAVRIRLRSDVPVGAYLSGGLDSSITVAAIRTFTSSPLKTFSVTFADPEFDESQYQRMVVERWGTDHHVIHCTGADIGSIFPRVVSCTEQPVLRTAPTPMFRLAHLVRSNDYKVVVTGEGADEVFGGYDIFKEAKVRRFVARHPDSKLRPQIFKKLYSYIPNIQAQSTEYLKSFFGADLAAVDDPFFSHIPRWDITSRAKVFFSKDVRASLQGHDARERLRAELPADFSRWDPFCQSQYLESAYLLPGYLLSSQGDRVAMGNSIEGRYPFLDVRVVEFASRLPVSLKMKGLDEKYLLRQLGRKWVPKGVLDRPKQPYRAPDVPSFFRPGPSAWVRDCLSEISLRHAGLFDVAAVTQLAKKCEKGLPMGVKDSQALVGILSTQLVHRQFVRGLPPETPSVETAAS